MTEKDIDKDHLTILVLTVLRTVIIEAEEEENEPAVSEIPIFFQKNTQTHMHIYTQ